MESSYRICEFWCEPSLSSRVLGCQNFIWPTFLWRHCNCILWWMVQTWVTTLHTTLIHHTTHYTYSPQYKLHIFTTLHTKLYSLHYRLRTIHYIYIHYTIHTSHNALHSAHNKLHTINYTHSQSYSYNHHGTQTLLQTPQHNHLYDYNHHTTNTWLQSSCYKYMSTIDMLKIWDFNHRTTITWLQSPFY